MDGEQGTFNTVNYPSPYPADLGKVLNFAMEKYFFMAIQCQ